MALPSPVAALPDLSALVQQNQARSTGLVNAAWAQLEANDQENKAKTAAVQQAAAAEAYRAEYYQPSDPRSRGYSAISEWSNGTNGTPGASSGPGGPSGAPGAAPADGNSAMAAFLPLLDKHEGGGRYDTLFGHAQRNDTPFKGIDVTQMTLGELRQFTDVNGAYGQWVKGQLAKSGQQARVATPMGRHQIVGTTLFNAAKAMNLPDNTVFSPAVQDNIAAHLARQRLASSNTLDGKIRGLRSEWEGFKHVSDVDLAAAIHQFEASA
jgi:hypothetical protein